MASHTQGYIAILNSNMDRLTYWSQRPRARAGQQRSTVPDWAWGIGLGLIVLAFVGGYFALGSTGGGSGGACDESLAPLGRSDITAEAFVREDADLAALLQLLNTGDLAAANAAFFGKPVHSFSHNVEPSVREADEVLGRDICKAVLALEDSLAFQEPPPETALKAQQVRNLMRDAAQALGFPRPG